MKKDFLLIPAIQDILETEHYVDQIREAFADVHSRKINDAFSGLSSKELSKAIFAFSIDKAISIFEHNNDVEKKSIFLHLDEKKQILVISKMSHDERIDLLKILPNSKKIKIVKSLDKHNKDDINLLYSYQEGSVGSIITSDYAFVSDTDTVQNTLNYLHQNSVEKEIIYYIYVVDYSHKLLGLVSLRQLMLSKSNKSIRDIMQTKIIKISVTAEAIEAAKIIKNYDFLALPAIDSEGRLIGIVTVDDVVDIVVEKETEEILSLAAAGKHIPYLQSSFLVAAKSRIVWLFILMGVGFLSGSVLERYQFILDQVLQLVFFIPLLCASAGNAGTQSATVVIRELSTDALSSNNLWIVWKKELLIGLSLGLFLGTLCLIKTLCCQSPVSVGLRLGMTVGLSMMIIISIATSCGALFPILFKKINLDPALMSAPLIASIVDVCALFTYLELARFFFNI